jgi:hypothetical protein
MQERHVARLYSRDIMTADGRKLSPSVRRVRFRKIRGPSGEPSPCQIKTTLEGTPPADSLTRTGAPTGLGRDTTPGWGPPRQRAAAPTEHAPRPRQAPDGGTAGGHQPTASRRSTRRLGLAPAPARGATAHKRACTVSPMLQEPVPSHDLGAAENHTRCRACKLQYFHKRAAQLGATLSPAEESSAASAVSAECLVRRGLWHGHWASLCPHGV